MSSIGSVFILVFLCSVSLVLFESQCLESKYLLFAINVGFFWMFMRVVQVCAKRFDIFFSSFGSANSVVIDYYIGGSALVTDSLMY